MNRKSISFENVSKKELLQKFKEYAHSYTPEWELDFQTPDIGMTIGYIFVDQMEENIRAYRELPEQYHSKFVDILGLTLMPPRPSNAVLLVQLMKNVIPGILLDTKSRFQAFSTDETFIFESVRPVYVTEAEINTIIMKSSNGMWSIPYGVFHIPDWSDKGCRIEERSSKVGIKAFTVKENELKNELMIRHGNIFCGNSDSIAVRIESGESLLEEITAGNIALNYICSNEKIPIINYQISSEFIHFLSIPEQVDGICMTENNSLHDSIAIEKISICAKGEEREADFVYNDIKSCNVETFEPFGDTLSLYAQCFIGSDSCFSKSGARITMSFDVTYGINKVGQNEIRSDNLKIIKRRRYHDYERVVSDTYVDEVIFEYETAQGYRTLKETDSYTKVLHEDDSKVHRIISFICPDDWKQTDDGGYSGRAVRMRILKADYCYLQPCNHHFPIIHNLTVAYDYKDNPIEPDKVEVIEGLTKRDITKAISNGLTMKVFEGKENSNSTKMYLGYHKKLQGGPVSIWVSIEEGVTTLKDNVLFYYYGSKSWKRLRVIDKTDHFTHSGTILFYPPSDMEQTDEFGEPEYYICIEGEKNGAVIQDISFNGVEVQNIDSGDEEDFYISIPEGNMEFDLDCRKLLDVDIWVNEMQEHTMAEMLQWQEERPDDVKIEQDYFGEITAFYVKWSESEHLSLSRKKRVYELDRYRGKICFGDGVHNMIPRNTSDIAFKAVLHYSNGQEGNVSAGSITDTVTNIMYVDNITNPRDAYGGSNMEQYNQLLRRGAGMVSSHGRFITQDDYLRAVKGYSDLIHDVSCYNKNRDIYIIILMSDYKNGPDSFYKIKGELMKYLMERSSITVQAENLHIEQPMFVDIHITVWIELTGDADAFAISSKIENSMEQYLNPVNGKKGSGWNMGILPKQTQLIMEINSIRDHFSVKNILITAGYTDANGYHECAIDEFECSPNVVIRSGKHKVYTE